jgi:hypothetical protein
MDSKITTALTGIAAALHLTKAADAPLAADALNPSAVKVVVHELSAGPSYAVCVGPQPFGPRGGRRGMASAGEFLTPTHRNRAVAEARAAALAAERGWVYIAPGRATRGSKPASTPASVAPDKPLTAQPSSNPAAPALAEDKPLAAAPDTRDVLFGTREPDPRYAHLVRGGRRAASPAALAAIKVYGLPPVEAGEEDDAFERDLQAAGYDD